MTVVHLHKVTGISGSENHLLHLLSGLAHTRFTPVLMMLTDPQRGFPDREYTGRLQRAGVRVESLAIRGDFDPILVASLVRWFRRERPAIVHTHLIHADVHGVVAARLAGVPVVVSTKHNDDPFRTRRSIVWLERWLARRTDRTIAISEWIRGFTLRVTAAPDERVVTVRYGYSPTNDDEHAPVSPFAAHGVPSDAIPIVSVGRLVEQKGHEYLIRAFAAIAPAFPRAWLVIVGEGERRTALMELARRQGLADRVVFAGYRPDALQYIRCCGIYVHPSMWEGFGLVLLEAMAAARPVVASRVSAIPEVVAHGVSGLLVPPRDPEALAAALTTLLRDPAAAVRFGRAGAERVAREFSVDAMVRGTQQVYETALNGNAHVRHRG
jgi:glycosyltransferase involved in cell wall biosynthesis